MFAEQIKRLQHRYLQLYQRVQKGDEAARLDAWIGGLRVTPAFRTPLERDCERRSQ